MSIDKYQLRPDHVEPTSLARNIFTAFVTNSQLCVTEDDLRSYAVNELKLSVNKITKDVLKHLPEILIAFMNIWPGWRCKKEFLAGKLKKEVYFEQFHNYMAHKMENAMRGHFTGVLSELEEQGNVIRSEEFSPYAISVQCPAALMNTIIFSNIGDDIIMKQHFSSAWQQLTPAQLLNWPYIEVSFRTQDIYIIRRQATEFVRYLNFGSHDVSEHTESVVEETKIFGAQQCYSYDFLEKYLAVYVKTLRTVSRISAVEFFEIHEILNQFLQDVKFIDVKKSMATNTAVLFRLAPTPFIKNKKLVKKTGENEEERVDYCEIITPKIQLLLPYFKPIQEDTPHLSFTYTQRLKNSSESRNIITPYISYKCTYCNVEYTGNMCRQLILTHLRTEHKMEQHIRCTRCKKQFQILKLTACRWRHKCLPT